MMSIIYLGVQLAAHCKLMYYSTGVYGHVQIPGTRTSSYYLVSSTVQVQVPIPGLADLGFLGLGFFKFFIKNLIWTFVQN